MSKKPNNLSSLLQAKTQTTTYSYDANGNLKRKIDKETNEMLFYRYNDFNQLVEHYKADQNDQYIYQMLFSYDGFNRRITKSYTDRVDETKSYAHHYLYDGENIVAILDANNDKQLLATIVHHPTQVDTPLSITNHIANKTYYYHRDHQGSIIALSNEEGKIVEEIEYDDHYGEILKHTKTEETLNIYGYTGRETDQSDLYYYRARYYDPTTQRFLSRDPIELEAGDFNFYRYVGGDCVNFRDPSGLDRNRSGGHGAGRTYNKPTNNKPVVNSDNHETMTPDQQEDSEFYRENGLLKGNCGKEGHWSAIFPILDISPKGCVKHDKCYSDCSKTQKECDDEFARTNPIYEIFVKLAGKAAYDEAQEHCECGK